MKRFIYTFFILGSFQGLAQHGPNLGYETIHENRKVCWIQNAGFFIDLPEGDVLIDAILGSNDDLANAKAPYNDVVLIFVSHVHGDHFNAQGIIKHLKANPKAKVILTPESFQALIKSGLDKPLENRILVSFPKKGTWESFSLNGFSGHTLQFNHSGVQNIGFGISGDHINLVYLNGGIQNQELIGDLSTKYPHNDILIANKWPLGKAEYSSKVENLFEPSWLLMAHHSGSSDRIVQNNGGVEKMEKMMSKAQMRGKVFTKKMECQNF